MKQTKYWARVGVIAVLALLGSVGTGQTERTRRGMVTAMATVMAT